MVPLAVWEYNVIGSVFIMLLGSIELMTKILAYDDSRLFGTGVILTGTILMLVSVWGYYTELTDLAGDEIEEMMEGSNESGNRRDGQKVGQT